MLCWECILITDRLKTISGGNYNFKSIHTPRTDQVLDMVRFRSSNSSKDKKKESLQVIIFFSSLKVTDLAKSSITAS